MPAPRCAILLALAALCGCAGPSGEQEAIRADPALVLSQPGDTALGCGAIEGAIAGMNDRITDQTANGHNGPTGNGATAYADGRGAESNEVLVAQKGTAEAATARADEMIRLGQAKRCFA